MKLKITEMSMFQGEGCFLCLFNLPGPLYMHLEKVRHSKILAIICSAMSILKSITLCVESNDALNDFITLFPFYVTQLLLLFTIHFNYDPYI